MSALKLGQFDQFRVVEVLEDYYQLENDALSVSLLKSDASRDLTLGEDVEAFLYIDQSKTVVATMQTPKITAYDPGFVTVVEKIPGLGVFVDIGLKKDMLVSKDDLPFVKDQWPEVGDVLFCHLRSGRNQMVAKMVSRFRITAHLNPEEELAISDTVKAYVFHLADEGLVFFTPSGHEIFVYYKHTRQKHRLGETCEVTIIKQLSRTKYNGTLVAQKELALDEDAERIYERLKKEGCVPYGDKSDADAIFAEFHLSKAAFKRAIGRLYKQQLVELKPHQTCLKKES